MYLCIYLNIVYNAIFFMPNVITTCKLAIILYMQTYFLNIYAYIYCFISNDIIVSFDIIHTRTPTPTPTPTTTYAIDFKYSLMTLFSLVCCGGLKQQMNQTKYLYEFANLISRVKILSNSLYAF